MTTTKLSFAHRFEPATGENRPLLLLHGTGGDETDLLPLGRAVAPGAALLSPRGQVLENGMPRFFRRLREGVFDEADVVRRANELADFVAEARETYGIGAPVALGFSNGANIAAAMLMLRPEALAGAALVRAMTPFREHPETLPRALAGKPVLILSGAMDQIVPAANSAALAAQLGAAGADMRHVTVPASHALTSADLRELASWFSHMKD